MHDDNATPIATGKPPRSAEERAQLLASPGFGKVFTDHMALIRYAPEGGWGPTRIEPYRPLSLDPASAVLHYGQSIFEGFKAYRQPDGRIRTFRPDANARRFVASAERLAMAPLPVERFVEAADALIRKDRDWVPGEGEAALYLRPFMFAADAFLGVRPSTGYLFVVIASPVGSYFAKGAKPVSVSISEEFVRAAPGGTGAAKCAGNYAASLAAQRQALADGCDQVVWLDAHERRYIEEMGGMNIFFVFEEPGRTVLVTPALTGSLLAGVTRDSLLQLGRDAGYEVEERKIGVDEWQKAAKEGRMTEAFACGTAAVVTPIGLVKSGHGSWTMPDTKVAMGLRKALVDLQFGRAPDRHGWMHDVA